MSLLNNKKVIVTGANKGIGKEIAISMAREGADILVHYNSDQAGANKTCNEIIEMGKNAYILQADFAKTFVPTDFIDKAVECLGGLDVLVNSAAAYRSKPFSEITAEDIDWMNRVNSEAPMLLIQAFAQYCKSVRKPGSIINISSISGVMPSINSTLNSCSKASLNMLTRSAALELADYKIRVNSIVLGLVDTESNYDFKKNRPKEWAKALSEIPLKRAGTPFDCAQLVIFLASNKSNWMTGAIIPLDGGMTISWKS